MKNILRTQHGFTMPAILIVSTSLFVIALGTLQAAVSIQSSLNNQYYNKLVQEAAEAGTAYAYACLEANNHLQTWVGPLTQKTDCNGSEVHTYDSILPSASNIKATFSVGDLEVSSTNTYLVVATGTLDVKNPSGTLTIKTFATTLKKSVSWENVVAGKSISGTNRTCGLISGSAYCWGDNTWGQLGNNTTTDSLTPVKVYRDPAVLGANLITDIAAGTAHNCVLAAGSVYCWGRNNYGQLGNGNTGTNSSVPIKVGGLLAGLTVTDIGTSTESSCAIAAGEVYCWGRDNFGQLGNGGTATDSNIPVKAVGSLVGKTATALSTSGARAYNMCAIADDAAFCWGANYVGEVGDNTNGTNRLSPVAVYVGGVFGGKTVTAISTDNYFVDFTPTSNDQGGTCAVASGAAYCWGKNTNGKLGNNGTIGSIYNDPVAVYTGGVLGGKTVTDIANGNEHACALADAKAYCWGGNGSGQLGNNHSTGNSSNSYRSAVPYAVTEQAGAFLGQSISNLGGGANRGCATASNKIYCWGLNNNGQIGDGTTTNRLVPTESIFLRPKNNVFTF